MSLNRKASSTLMKPAMNPQVPPRRRVREGDSDDCGGRLHAIGHLGSIARAATERVVRGQTGAARGRGLPVVEEKLVGGCVAQEGKR